MKISEHVRYVGVNDLRGCLFENQWSLPKGVSYNSYLVVDEKIALIDTAAAAFSAEFIRNIKSEIGDRDIDFLVVNHMEPDHSALMSVIRKEYPNIQIVTNAKAVPMIAGYQGITDNVKVIKEGERLSLGNLNLAFYMDPMVHWPETMVTYLEEEQTLFSGDAFGCFGALDESITDGFPIYRDEMVRYYASIVGKYGQPVQTALKKLSNLSISRICSTHGPIWESDINDVVSLYDRMSRYETDKGVCIVYGSMYGNTEKAAQAIKDKLELNGVNCVLHNAVEENPSFIYKDVFEYDMLICGAPTYNNDIFPAVRNILYGVCARMVKNHKFAAFGSFTWAGASVRLMNEMASAAGLKVVSEGMPFSQGYSDAHANLDKFIEEILAQYSDNA